MRLRRPRRKAPRATGVPCLKVADITEAIDYYENVLGFHSIRWHGATSAFLSGHGTTIHLRQEPHERPSQTCGPDAVLHIPRPRSLRLHLDDLRAPLLTEELTEEWAEFFGVADCSGNVLAIGRSAGPGARVERWALDPVDDLSRRVNEWRRRREERPHLDELRRFYEGLADKKDIFYLFFSSGLLHWVRKALSYVPESVNLVLIGSDLPPEELTWIKNHVRRPFHHVSLRIDDQIAWDFLFSINRRNFGWLDSDCLVLNPHLFAELADIDEKSSLNCTWSWDSGHGVRLANTFLLFVNVDVIEKLRARGLDTSPYSHDYEWQNLHVPGRRCYSRRPSRKQLRHLSTFLPDDGSGRIVTPKGMPYFDTMVMYQLLARACGYPINLTRRLEGFGHIRGLQVQDESSDELLHVGGASRADALDETSGYFHDSDVRLLYVIAESIVLSRGADGLPAYYDERHREILATLDRNGLSPQSALTAIRRHLMEVRGMSDSGVSAITRPASGDRRAPGGVS
jgi:catechol 2,3-dioxygenase-like lactoylglutathione lyase family enzyme